MTKFIAIAALATLSTTANAALTISEVHPTGSSTFSYGSDWFELTNTGATAFDISGYKVDDNSNAFATARDLLGVTSIAPGQSVIFMEATPATAADKIAAFKAVWFGSNVPADLLIGTYSGSGIGLSSSGDNVVIFDGSGNRVVGVDFGAATLSVTFDNAAGAGGTAAPFPIIARLSEVGVNGAFTSADGEIGSPGRIAAIPEPTALGLIALAGVAMAARRRA